MKLKAFLMLALGTIVGFYFLNHQKEQPAQKTAVIPNIPQPDVQEIIQPEQIETGASTKLPVDLANQLATPPPELPDDLKAQLEMEPPEIPEDLKRALEQGPRKVSIDEVNSPDGMFLTDEERSRSEELNP